MGDIDASSQAPAEAFQWWETLPRQRRAELIAEQPEALCGLDGMPVEVRDCLNRARLISALSEGDESALEAFVDFVKGVFGRANRIGLSYLQQCVSEPSSTGQPYYLIRLDAEGDGKAVVALGNPDTAANIAVYVPGTTARIADTSLEGEDDNFHRLDTLAVDARAASEAETAVIYWLGYDAPDQISDAGFESYAQAAAADLSRFTLALRRNTSANLTMLGHSYGSTVIGVTARDQSIAADNVILIGSPGLGEGIETAADLGVDPSRVWVSMAENDIIDLVDGWHGTSPIAPEFGAQLFHSAPEGHEGYFWHSNEAARSTIARIITGTI